MGADLSQEAASRDSASLRLRTATAWLTALACIAMPLSIAVSQTLLAAALLCLLLTREPLCFPRRLQLPVLGFALWTLLAVAFSPAPASGLPQVRKLFVFFVILLVSNAFLTKEHLWRTVRWVLLAGTAAALYGLGQFAAAYYRLTQQRLPFYENYVLHQITGFMSHWMTFGGQLMLLLLLLLSIFLFAKDSRGRSWSGILWGWLGAITMALALLAAFTRGIWLGTLLGAAYLVACYRRWMLLLIPAAVLALYLVSPTWLQRRNESIFATQRDSSSMARIVMAQTGLKMIAAHPLFGVGPERVGREFARFAPPGEPLPEAWYGHLHNSFLHTAAERGIPCIMFLLWMLLEVLRYNAARLRDAAASALALSYSAIAATIGMVVTGLFEYNFGDSEVLMLYLFLISLPYAWERAGSGRAPQTSPETQP